MKEISIVINLRRVVKERWKAAASKHRVVEILWWDAIGVSGDEWANHKDAYDTTPAQTLTVGYVVKETPDYITVVSMLNPNHLGYGVCIPKGMIKEIRDLTSQ
jgi:hypothetical protein